MIQRLSLAYRMLLDLRLVPDLPRRSKSVDFDGSGDDNAGRADAVRGQDDVTACANAATTMTLRDEVSRGREREYGWPRRQQCRCACDKDSQPCDYNTRTTPLLLHALAPARTSSTTPA